MPFVGLPTGLHIDLLKSSHTFLNITMVSSGTSNVLETSTFWGERLLLWSMTIIKRVAFLNDSRSNFKAAEYGLVYRLQEITSRYIASFGTSYAIFPWIELQGYVIMNIEITAMAFVVGGMIVPVAFWDKSLGQYIHGKWGMNEACALRPH